MKAVTRGARSPGLYLRVGILGQNPKLYIIIRRNPQRGYSTYLGYSKQWLPHSA